MLIFGGRHLRSILAEYEAITAEDDPVSAAQPPRHEHLIVGSSREPI